MADEKTAEELAAEHTKAELEAAAAVEGVEVKSKDTKADIAAKLAESAVSVSLHARPGSQGQFIHNNVLRRSDNDAVLGSWVDVVAGEHAGRYGAFYAVSQSDEKGFPTTAMVRTRDADNLLLEVPYESLRPSERAGGR